MKSKRNKAARALQKQIKAARNSRYRPKYHFSPPANWMNDPNGTIFINGEYHLFYQHNPYKPRWGRIHWGHAKSADLVHWEHLPIALAPDRGLRELHCFSGCCVLDQDGTPTIFYTSISARSFLTGVHRYAEQWAATSDTAMLVWEKHPQNPILSEKTHHPDGTLRNWRDPYIWKELDSWYMVLAGQRKGENYGSVLLYKSPDLYEWDYLGRLYQGDPSLGKTWECPNYFRLGDKYVLIVSPFGQVIYSIGVFKDHKHQTDAWFNLDHGKNFYATNTYPREKGSVILVGWVKAKGNGPWAGCLSLPREASLSDEGQLLLRPIPELEILRRKHRRFQRTLDSNVELTGSAPYFGECVEIKANYNLADAKAVGFTLIDDEGEYQIRYDFSTQTLTAIDEVANLQFPEDSHQLDLHIFIDESIIEIFINGKETFTTVFYPKLDAYNSLKISPYFLKVQGTVEIDFWTLDEIGI